MNYKLVTIFTLVLQTSACTLGAQDAKINKHLSASELKRQAKQAQTVEDLHRLAEGYRREESLFRRDAEQEKAELARRIQQTGGRTMKYPSPVDSARNLYQYDIAEADEMANKAESFDAQAAPKR
jgi:hypothetical protein